ncbi:hypothetical protein Thermo_01698 [Thermoplasmatales archaeon]|nr:hypothetical protein Thermo_01698 [Thermoplasmatales archaeon]
MGKEDEVVIELSGGVATVTKIPEGIRVKIIDFDVESVENSCSEGSEPTSIRVEEGPYDF